MHRQSGGMRVRKKEETEGKRKLKNRGKEQDEGLFFL